MEMRRYGLMLHGEHDLDQAGYARGGFQMPQIGFDRTQPTGAAIGPRLSHDGCQRLDFDRITERGAGSVRFDIAQLATHDSSVLERLAEDCFLRKAIRGCQYCRATILIYR